MENPVSIDRTCYHRTDEPMPAHAPFEGRQVNGVDQVETIYFQSLTPAGVSYISKFLRGLRKQTLPFSSLEVQGKYLLFVYYF